MSKGDNVLTMHVLLEIVLCTNCARTHRMVVPTNSDGRRPPQRNFLLFQSSRQTPASAGRVSRCSFALTIFAPTLSIHGRESGSGMISGSHTPGFRLSSRQPSAWAAFEERARLQPVLVVFTRTGGAAPRRTTALSLKRCENYFRSNFSPIQEFGYTALFRVSDTRCGT